MQMADVSLLSRLATYVGYATAFGGFVFVVLAIGVRNRANGYELYDPGPLNLLGFPDGTGFCVLLVILGLATMAIGPNIVNAYGRTHIRRQWLR